MNNLILRGLALRKFTLSAREGKGFTLIELLIVIALIGILAVALLSAINPLEQLRKGRDSARRADAAELLSAIERFQASYQCYPWNYSTGACAPSGSYMNLSTGEEPNILGVGGNLDDLLTVSEVKQEFASRVDWTATSGPSAGKLFMAEVGGSLNIEGLIRVCFEPESNTGRTNGLGQVINSDISIAVPTYAACAVGGYSGGGSYAMGCNLCVPQ